MKRIEKTVFISYRRTNAPWALAIYQYLHHNGYDVFFDYINIPAGDFEQVILDNIKARAHFIIILTPSALEKCGNPNDWLRREIECAMDNNRNIIPIMLEGFDFGIPIIAKHLTGKLELLSKYNGMTAPVEYFEAAMEKLCNQFLSIPLDAVLHPTSKPTEEKVKSQKEAANAAPPVTEEVLTAQQWFEKGYLSYDLEEQIRCYSKAIELDPEYADAYFNRGNSYAHLEKHERAIEDYGKAIELNPDYVEVYNNRGLSYIDLEKYELAIEDYDKAIELNPVHEVLYNNRGLSYAHRGKHERAIEDYGKAIKLNPEFAVTYKNRGLSYAHLGKHERAIEDYGKVIKLNPEDAVAYYNRGISSAFLRKYERAIEDYAQAIDLNPEDDKSVYNTACAYALKHQAHLACTWLRKAIKMELQCFVLAKTDKDFDPIRDTSEFQELLKEFEQKQSFY